MSTSSDLGEDAGFSHPALAARNDLDLVLLNVTPDPWGAHVVGAVRIPG